MLLRGSHASLRGMNETGIAILGIIVFSAIVVGIGMAIGHFDYSVDDEAHINMEYRPAAGDRRW